MTVQTKFNMYQNDRPVTEKSEQIVLSCSIDTAMKGGAEKVLCRRATVNSVRATAGDGQASVSGKLNLKAVYVTPEGELDSIDYVSDFSKTVACLSATEGATIIADAKVADVQAATEGGTIRMQTVVELTPIVIVHNEYELLEDAEDAFVKSGENEFGRLTGIFETECSVDEQYATGAVVEKVLAFDTQCQVCKVTEDGDGALVEGDVCVTIVYQSEGKAVQKNMILPFVHRTEGKDGATYEVRAEVKDSKLIIGGSATENVFEVKAVVGLCTVVIEKVCVSLAKDVYCPVKELKLSRLCLSYDSYAKTVRTRERISGSVETDGEDTGVGRIIAAFATENQVATVDAGENGITVEGVLETCVIYLSDNDEYKSVSIDLPYTAEVSCASAGKITVSVSECDITAKVKRDREIEVTATVCVSVNCCEKREICAVDGLEEGADIKPCEDSVSVYFAKCGETFWDVAKKLSMSPEQIALQNSSLGEVLADGEKVIVYREAAV